MSKYIAVLLSDKDIHKLTRIANKRGITKSSLLKEIVKDGLIDYEEEGNIDEVFNCYSDVVRW